MAEVRRFVVTAAVNATPVHAGFWAALKRYIKRTGAHLVPCEVRYKNPTSRYSKEDSDGDWFAPELSGLLQSSRLKLCRNLTLYADVPTQPTDSRPLSGYEVFCGESSGIFPHPRRHLATVPSGSRMPRLLATTGACTVANYTRSKRGKKAEAHHVIGALVVEIEPSGVYHLRHITAERSGSFIDLDTYYHPDRVELAPRADSVTLGDLHAGRECAKADAGTKAILARLRPRNVFGHDVLDFHSRSHHEKTLMGAHARRAKGGHWDDVRAELAMATARVREVAGWASDSTFWIVRSNHDTHFERWLEECEPKKDVKNAPYYFEVWARMFRHYSKHGHWPMAFELEARRLGVPARVRFLELNASKKIHGVENGNHGHLGANGARGSLVGYSKLGCKTNTGHGHAPGFLDGAARGGVAGDLNHGYNNGPSSWLVGHIAQYGNGKRTLLLVIDGRAWAP